MHVLLYCQSMELIKLWSCSERRFMLSVCLEPPVWYWIYDKNVQNVLNLKFVFF